MSRVNLPFGCTSFLSLFPLKTKVHGTVKSRTWLFKGSEGCFFRAGMKMLFSFQEENDSKEHLPEES